MSSHQYEVLIIGAGAAGLMAARELALAGKRVAVIEALPRTGGRIHTVHDPQFSMPIERGAEFIHGKLPLTLSLLQQAGLTYTQTEGELWQKKGGRWLLQEDFIEDFSTLQAACKQVKEDMPVKDFMERYLAGDDREELRFTLKNYVEGYYAGELHKASTGALCKELAEADEEQYRIEGGYQKLIDFLTSDCIEKGCFFSLSTPVQQVQWQRNGVMVTSANGMNFRAKKIIITVSVGVWQQDKIQYIPSLHQKVEAAKSLGFGPAVKIIFQFNEPFWKDKKYTQQNDLSAPGFLFSREIIPTWWSQLPATNAVLTGWCAGPHAAALKGLSEEAIKTKGLQSLGALFDTGLPHLQQKVVASQIAGWINEPYTHGAYSYEVVNGKMHQQVLKETMENSVFVAGEGLFDGVEIGTVEAAFHSGREVAHKVLAAL